jgi:hypothetical protein
MATTPATLTADASPFTPSTFRADLATLEQSAKDLEAMSAELRKAYADQNVKHLASIKATEDWCDSVTRVKELEAAYDKAVAASQALRPNPSAKTSKPAEVPSVVSPVVPTEVPVVKPSPYLAAVSSKQNPPTKHITILKKDVQSTSQNTVENVSPGISKAQPGVSKAPRTPRAIRSRHHDFNRCNADLNVVCNDSGYDIRHHIAKFGKYCNNVLDPNRPDHITFCHRCINTGRFTRSVYRGMSEEEHSMRDGFLEHYTTLESR